MAMPAFTVPGVPPQNITALWPVLIFHPAEGRGLSWPKMCVCVCAALMTVVTKQPANLAVFTRQKTPMWRLLVHRQALSPQLVACPLLRKVCPQQWPPNKPCQNSAKCVLGTVCFSKFLCFVTWVYYCYYYSCYYYYYYIRLTAFFPGQPG